MGVGEWRIWRLVLLRDLVRIGGLESVGWFCRLGVVLWFGVVLLSFVRSRGLACCLSCSYMFFEN